MRLGVKINIIEMGVGPDSDLPENFGIPKKMLPQIRKLRVFLKTEAMNATEEVFSACSRFGDMHVTRKEIVQWESARERRLIFFDHRIAKRLIDLD